MSGPSPTAAYWCELAWVPPGRVAAGVEVVVADGRIVSVSESAPCGPDHRRLDGLVLPGLANVHSHAFHRALRGHTQRERGSFWTWREQMYAVAARLDPDSYLALARATYAEMALAGITAVGEFHYLHHGPDGTPYDDPNEMGRALLRAARDAGIRITLLDTCYLAGGFGRPLEGVQRRFGDGDGESWAQRCEMLATACAGADGVVVGAALHSVRGVPVEAMPHVVTWADRHDAPLHVHLSEQVAENDACVAATGRTPTALLDNAGALGPRLVAVHATHLTDGDIAVLGGSGSGVCMCPTTERDLADGVGPARRLALAGATISLGSDSHAVIDPYEELRGLELDERLVTGERGHWSTGELIEAATAAGHRALGIPDAGTLSPGRLADLVAVRLDSIRTAGWDERSAAEAVVFGATAADVTDVVVGGRQIVADGAHLLVEDVAGELASSIRAVRTGL